METVTQKRLRGPAYLDPLPLCQHGAPLIDGAGELLEPTCGCRFADSGPLRGPYHISRGYIVDPRGITIAKLMLDTMSPESVKTNMLLVAAPQLHQACLNLISVIESLVPEKSARGVANVVLEEARSAITGV